jgi:hypothetical protein
MARRDDREHRTPLERALAAMHEAGVRATIDPRQHSGATLVSFYKRGAATPPR